MEKNVKSTQEIVAILDKKIARHRKEINQVVEEISGLKKKPFVEITPEDKQKVMKSVMIIAEHKSVINVLNEVLQEISK